MTESAGLAYWVVLGMFAAAGVGGLSLFARLLLQRGGTTATGERHLLRELASTYGPLAVFVLAAAVSLRIPVAGEGAPAPDLSIHVTGHMWYWSYEYPDSGDFRFSAPMLAADAGIAPASAPSAVNYDLAHHIVVPTGRTVRIVAEATNIIYSWSIPAIGAKISSLPGRASESWFQAGREGHYYGECYELCSVPHTFLPIEVEVVSEERFRDWAEEARSKYLAAAASPARLAAGP